MAPFRKNIIDPPFPFIMGKRERVGLKYNTRDSLFTNCFPVTMNSLISTIEIIIKLVKGLKFFFEKIGFRKFSKLFECNI